MRKRFTRLLDRVAPVRPPGADRGYRRLLRWAALPVTDRRWAAPLAAGALGFGLFAGVAIGPGTPGTMATGAPQVIELPSLLSSDDNGGEEAGEARGEPEAFAEAGAREGGEELAFPEEEASSSAFEAFPEEETAEAPAGEPAPAAEEEPANEADTEEAAQTIGGLVVHANPAAGSYTVVEAGGLMNVVHAAKLPVPGTKVSVPVRTLANGTFAEEDKRKQTGTSAGTTIAGVVTFVDPDPAAPAYAVSKRGVSVLVRVRPDPTGAPPMLPQLGAYAIVKVEIEKVPATGLPPVATPTTAVPGGPAAVPPAPTCARDPAVPLTVPAPTAILWQTSVDADGAPFASSDFAGVVTAVCPTEAKLALSGDDLRQAGADVVLTVPPSIDVTGLEVGDSVIATAKIGAGGALTLTGLAGDERTKGADDPKAAQGDLVSHKPQ